jgi:Asp-tRNA(Asn)/Glu-tRNA(Gln) amidotransferase A subunit family amidase
MIDLNNLTIKKAHQDIKSGKYSCVDLANAYLNEIKSKNRDINAYLEIFDDVIEQAQESDKRFKEGTATLLTGSCKRIGDASLISS